jgi:hypothetical protein
VERETESRKMVNGESVRGKRWEKIEKINKKNKKTHAEKK